MNNTHHYLWIFIAFCCLGVVTYIFTINRPNVQKGGYEMDYHPQNWPLSIHLGEGSCARMDSLKGDKNVIAPNKTVSH